MSTMFTIVCVGTGASKTYHYKDRLIMTKDLFAMYYNRLRTLGYKRHQLVDQRAEHLFEMYERHKEWMRKGIVSPQLKLLVS